MRFRKKRLLIGCFFVLGLLLSLSLVMTSVFLKPRLYTAIVLRNFSVSLYKSENLHPTHRRSTTLRDHRFTYQLNISDFKREFPCLQSYNCTILEEEDGFCHCPECNPLLILAIKSHPMSAYRRMATRQTWAAEREVSGYHVKTLFLMAKTENASHMQLVAREIKEYHDILQWDFVESHHNLSLKERCFLEWVHYNCKEVEFIFKGDDDEFVNPEAVVKYVKETPEAAHTIHGNMQTKSVVMHTGKYRVSKSLFPYCLYPIFPSGGGFILPGAFIPALYQVSTWLPVFPLDDVYFGFLALAANLSLRHDERFDTLGTLNGICSYKKALVIHGVSPERLVQIWQSMQNMWCLGHTFFLPFLLLALILASASLLLIGVYLAMMCLFIFPSHYFQKKTSNSIELPPESPPVQSILTVFTDCYCELVHYVSVFR
ncbi:beta-1,3-galactosyltransferase 5-like [Pleurodeles waltl]|uniref:beta-1,3-galactosyltransferase 5-like n=1 Tax=Pleurodeles waltl TaxID=8319 RepID=UPI00370996DF